MSERITITIMIKDEVEYEEEHEGEEEGEQISNSVMYSHYSMYSHTPRIHSLLHSFLASSEISAFDQLSLSLHTHSIPHDSSSLSVLDSTVIEE